MRRLTLACTVAVLFGFGCSGNDESSPDSDSASVVDPSGGDAAVTTAPPPPPSGPTGSTTCDVKVAAQHPLVLRDLKDEGFTISATTNGKGCSFEIEGAKHPVDCGATFQLTGADIGTGFHEVKLRIDSGPSGVAQCSKFIKVRSPAACHASTTAGTIKQEVDFQFDVLGRTSAQVLTYVAGQTGQVVYRYKYDGDSARISTLETRFVALPGVAATRVDTNKYIYKPGPPDPTGAVIDLNTTVESDTNTDGTIDVKQTLTYDPQGRLTVIDQDNANDGTIDVRYTRDYDTKGRLAAQHLDEKADGTVEDTMTPTYDNLGVLQKQSWQTHGETTFRYVCP